MLIDVHKDVVNVSDDIQLNLENYMESLNYMSNLYSFINKLNTIVVLTDVKFLPTFKGEVLSQKLNIEVDDKESQMKLFKVKSQAFLEEKIQKKIDKVFSPLCEKIEITEDIITFILI